MSKQEWGYATWTLFHTLAEKIQEDKFLHKKQDLIDIIFGVATHLPCPDCSEHANKELKQVNIDLIKDKQHLIEFIRQFHNNVNLRLNKKQFTLDEVKDLYKLKNTNIVIKNFLIIYKKQAYNPKLLLSAFYRSKYFNKVVKLLMDLRPYLDN